VRVASIVPSLKGEPAQIYVRQRVDAGLALRGGAGPDKVVLFVHGAGTPAEVAFDTPAGDHSWMAYLAEAGFDVFALDTTGYGRSTRPAPMNDPCNLVEAQQPQFVRSLIAAPCKPSYPGRLTSLGSDWHDIDAVVDHIRKIRGAAYNREAPATPPATLPAPGVVFNTQSRGEFIAKWDRQVGSPDRVRAAYDDLGASDKVYVDLACSSHNAMWERNHRLMFEASLQWLQKGAVGEQKSGIVRLGY
jgi:hypothetical protein